MNTKLNIDAIEDHSIPIEKLQESIFDIANAMVYKGSVNANSDLPAVHKVGWTYRVNTAGEYVGVNCEVGDLIICIVEGTSQDDTHWSVGQTNIDGAVVGPTSSTSGNVVVFDGETGKFIKDSGKQLTPESIGALSSSGGELTGDLIAPNFIGDLQGNANFATDLTGRNEATAEEFTLRPSAGNKSIRDDSATIKRIKGNSIVWNQLSQVFPHDNTRSAHGVSATNIAGTHYIECSGTTTAIEGDSSIYVDSDITPKIKGVSGHKYLFLVEGCRNLQIIIYSFISPSKKITNGGTIVTCTANNYVRYTVSIPTSTPVGTTINEKISVLYIDLTQMFGAGNEPDTVEEFRALFPGNHYEYNPGQLVSMTANGLFTNGFNQWDEEWVNGYYRIYADSGVGNDGGFVENSSYIATAKPMKVLPNTQYYIKSPYGVLFGECDIEGNYTGNHYYVYAGNTFTTPSNCFYLLFYVDKAITNATYNNDVCINLSHTGVENGKYEPYWNATKDLSIIQKYFPNGMRSAGSIYDEISFDETTQKWVAIQRVGTVDLGSLSWSQNPSYGFYVSIEALSGIQNVTDNNINANILCTKYTTGRAGDIFTQVKTNSIAVSTTHLVVGDLTYNTANDFKTAMSGVMLNYELAEPIITVIEEPINLSYKVGDFGIEQILSDSFSAPFRADIIYQFNATDRIRENSLNIEKLSKTQNEYLPLAGGTMSGQINSQDIKPVEDSTYQLGDSTHKYDNVFSNFFTGDLEGNAKTATDLTGRIEATPEVFTYRPSAGEKSIKDNNAFIRRVKGNSVVWNQLVGESVLTNNGVTPTTNNGVITLSGTPTTTWFNVLRGIPVVLGHKMLLQLFVVANPNNIDVDFGDLNNHALVSSLTGGGTIYEVYGQTFHFLSFSSSNLTNIDFTGYQMRLMYTDLTQMFGAGNEPNTIEEFRALYPDSYYPYNPGELRNLDCSGIKTVGFNQWDEQWESGVYKYWSDGQKSDSSEYIRSTNFIKVIPTNTYCLNIAQGVDAGVGFYDENNNFLGQASYSYSNNSRLFQVPANCQKITFYTKATTYNNDICINLSHTGVRDGDYEPYKEVTHSLPLSQITNGQPLRKAGSVYDEINETHYIKRVGVVDLGSLTYSKSDNFPNLFISKPFGAAGADADKIANLFCPKYITMTAYDPWSDIISMGMDTSNQLYIYDPQYTDIEAFKSAMSGIMLNYELAEPIVTPIETPIDFNYYVEDFGTEEAILAENSTPFNADIIYQFNATDRIRENSLNIEKLSKTQNECLLLAGGTMFGQLNSQDIKPVEDSTYQLGDLTHKYDNVFSNFFTGNLEGNAKTATVATDLSGRVEATPEVFTYRPSAGEKSIKDDNAFIRRVKGNSVVWNQQLKTLFSPNVTADTVTTNGITFTRLSSGGYNISGSNNTSTSALSNNTVDNLELKAGHKYIIIPIGLKKSVISFYGPASGVSSFITTNMRIITPTNSAGILLRSVVQAGVIDVNETIYCNVHDLTQMFGAGNEPATVEEFRALYPDSYYPYNTGELRNLDCSGIKTVGFNQWDEQWEVGYLNADGTTAGYVQNYIRAKNYIPVIRGAMYYASVPDGTSDAQLYAVDENYNLIKHIQPWKNTKFVIPDGAAYIRFYLKYGSEIYNNDICINISHTGVRDGEYEPYKEVTHALPLSQITNGEPLRKAGSVYDEINETHYIKRVGVVDLGSLTWRNDVTNIFACTEMPSMIVTTDVALRLDGLFCTKYAIDTIPIIDATMSDKTMKRNNGWLYIKDTSFTDVASFKASLSGVLLHYELAEPIVTPIETPIDFNYYVEDFGTEEALLTEDSAPFSADIVYQFNATDQIRNNSRNIDKLQKSAFTPRGTSAQYIRGDGSYGNVLEFTQAIPINDGEYEMPDAIHQFILTPNYYAKSPVELDNTTTVTVYVTPPEDSNYLAEYWFEFKTGEVLPDITFTSSTEDTKFRIAGDMLGDAVNILHLISSDGGMTFFGEMKHYIL